MGPRASGKTQEAWLGTPHLRARGRKVRTRSAGPLGGGSGTLRSGLASRARSLAVA